MHYYFAILFTKININVICYFIQIKIFCGLFIYLPSLISNLGFVTAGYPQPNSAKSLYGFLFYKICHRNSESCAPKMIETLTLFGFVSNNPPNHHTQTHNNCITFQTFSNFFFISLSLSLSNWLSHFLYTSPNSNSLFHLFFFFF